MTFADVEEQAARYIRGEINGDQWLATADAYIAELLANRDPDERRTGNRLRDAVRCQGWSA